MGDGVIYSCDPEKYRSKEDAYIGVRGKENRLLSDDVVKRLPLISEGDEHYKEWLLRKKSFERLVQKIAKRQPTKILDVGCGNGWTTKKLAEEFPSCKIIGVDLNQKELQQAVRISEGLDTEFYYADIINDSPFEYETFDIILFNASIQYFEDLILVFDSCYPLLKLEGMIIINDSPIYASSEDSLQASDRSESYYSKMGVQEMSEYYFHHSKDKLVSLGFAEERKRIFNRYPFPLYYYTKKSVSINSDKVSQAFGNQSIIFDEIYDSNPIQPHLHAKCDPVSKEIQPMKINFHCFYSI